MRSVLTRLALVAGLVVLVLLVALLALLPSQGAARDLSVYSAEAQGWRALYLTLEGLGFPVEPWTRAPAELPARGTLLVQGALPDRPPSMPAALAEPDADAEARTTPDGTAGPRRGRDLVHYRRFVEDGGTLLVLGAGADELSFLRDELTLSGLEGIVFEVPQTMPSELELPGGERVGRSRPEGHFSFPRGETLVRAGERAAGAVFASGKGRVALLALPSERFDNGDLAREGERMLLVVRLIEALRPPGASGASPFARVLFDEYALGAWRPASVLELAFAPGLALLSLHALLLAALLLWRSAWSGPFARDPEPLRAASPLARARGFGRTLARARRFDLLARFLRRGLLARWDARSGVRLPGEPDAAEEEARLRRLARGDERRLARLRELCARVPASEAELARLETELCALEPELVLGAPPKTRPPAGRPPAVPRS